MLEIADGIDASAMFVRLSLYGASRIAFPLR